MFGLNDADLNTARFYQYVFGECLMNNAVELSRHTGRDRRYPDCRDASKPCRPWSLGSGGPCRNDGESFNSTEGRFEGEATMLLRLLERTPPPA